MKLEDDFEDEYDYDDYYEQELSRTSSKTTFRYAVIIGSVSVLGILMIVLLLNSGNGKRSGAQVSSPSVGTMSEAELEHSQNVRMEDSVEELLSGSTLTAEDLDIWDERAENTVSEDETDVPSADIAKEDEENS